MAKVDKGAGTKHVASDGAIGGFAHCSQHRCSAAHARVCESKSEALRSEDGSCCCAQSSELTNDVSMLVAMITR